MTRSGDIIDSEAADWLARLNADSRTEADEREFHSWLSADPAHQAAFDEATTIWNTVGAVPRDMLRPSVQRPGSKHRREVMAALGITLVGVSSFVFWGGAEAKVYKTNVGERKRIVLEDQSIAILDTDTLIRVKFTENEREVRLDRGRVNFHVSTDAKRPFKVSSAEHVIVTQQSDFDVRRDGTQLSVVLVAGNASVESGAEKASLSSGQRLTSSTSGMRLDKPSLLPLLAWKKGQAILENQRLIDAVTEMNRYSSTKLAVGNSAVAEMRVSGVYQTGDSIGFARSVAKLLPLRLVQKNDQVLFIIDASRMQQG